MNQELKQRLIGAVVVTALAAIFIPMLFDDPVDNSGQLVSELIIPKTPVNTGEESANKLPTNADQVLNKHKAGSETVVNTEEESELSANNQLPLDEPVDDGPEIDTEAGLEPSADEPGNDHSPKSLNTGVIDKTKKTVKKADSSTSKQMPQEQALISEPVNKPEKPSSELSRWYLQAGTFSKKENAASLLEKLHKQGLPATLETIKGAGNTPLYRIKVGPALEKKRAAEMKAKLDSQKIPSFIISE
jgi:DedD protein